MNYSLNFIYFWFSLKVKTSCSFIHGQYKQLVVKLKVLLDDKGIAIYMNTNIFLLEHILSVDEIAMVKQKIF